MKRAALVVWVAACGSRASSPVPPSHAAEQRRTMLVAAREGGLYEITADGRDVRQLSATPAQHPRWQVPARRLVFLTRDTTELRSLELDTAKEQVVARVKARLECPGFTRSDGVDPAIELQIQDDRDFLVHGTRACLRLMDRNSNMASYSMDVHVDLTTGKIADYLSIAAEECKLPRREAPEGCEGTARPAPSAGADEGRELEHAGPAGFTVHSRSPTGRWVLLRGNDMEGDYMHHQVVLYELATRRSFPVAGEHASKGGAWPAPLSAEQLALAAEQLGPIVGDVVGETPIYWLEGRDDRLVIGEDLVVPGVRVVRVGQLAF